jgi:uncharacterized iron-regulated membrane protein
VTLRRNLLLAHRWAGIALGAFLVLAGATGSFLAFHHEIDAVLAPELHVVTVHPTRASLDAIAAAIEARHPHLAVGYFVFSTPEASVRAVMNTREAADAGKLDREGASPSEVYVDPYSGRLLGERKWGEPGLSRAHLVPMVYRLHTSLFLDKAGQWITAIVAAIWLASMTIGMVLALPRAQSWRKAVGIHWRGSRARVLFDVHRSAGIAAFVVLGVMAFTGVYMNIPSVVEPIVASVAPFTERPASIRVAGASREEVWRIGWDAALTGARRLEPVHAVAVLGRSESRGYYQARFMPPGDIVDAGTIRVFVDGRDGSPIGRVDDRRGSVGDQIRIWQFPLHSGQGFGLPGRILVCVAGAFPFLLAVTGIGLWLRRVQQRRQAHNMSLDPALAAPGRKPLRPDKV